MVSARGGSAAKNGDEEVSGMAETVKVWEMQCSGASSQIITFLTNFCNSVKLKSLEQNFSTLTNLFKILSFTYCERTSQ